MLIEQMDNDIDISPELTDRARQTQTGSLAGQSGLRASVDPALDAESNPDMVRAPKRLCRTSVRNVLLPTAAITLRSRRAERLWRQKRKKVLHRAARGVGGDVS
jgi:hypothetical protein